MLSELTAEEVAEIRGRYLDLANYQAEDTFSPWDPLAYLDSGGDSLLHIAAMRGDARTASLLLKAGANPNAAGDMGYTPLHYAYWKRHNDVTELLLAHGARTDIRNEFGKLPEEEGDDIPGT
jgi:ankyrin repeat protein